MGKRIALLRGINVGGGNKVPMAELRALCGTLGWGSVETYIQSGNVVFEAEGEGHEAALENAVAERFGLSIPVAVRAADQWSAYIASNPFPNAAESEPNRLLLTLSKAPLAPDAVAALRKRASFGERVAEAAGALWIHYPDGAGRSKLMPGLIDRLAGSPCTSRNWRTAVKIGEMLE